MSWKPRCTLLASTIGLMLFVQPFLTPVFAMPVDPISLDPQFLEESEELFADAQRTSIYTYQTQSGDTLWSIAAQFGLDVDTLRWSNPELARNPDRLSIGQELTILPLPGAYVAVQPGDTLETLAARWGVVPGDISNYPLNGLQPGEVPEVGAMLVIPHGSQSFDPAPPAIVAGYAYQWPIRGYVTQRYSAGHRGVDLGAPYGSSVYASRSGTCISMAFSTVGYGYLVILQHDDGSRTYYSHLKGAWVNVGDWVPVGGLVGEVGSTGNSTGPHVHFEIRIGGIQQNPLGCLPPQP